MSRGKHRRAKRARDQRTRASTAAALREQLTAEAARYDAARAAAARTRWAAQRLVRETACTRARLAPLEADTDRTAQRIGPAWQQLRTSLHALQHAHDRLNTATGKRNLAAAAVAAGLRITTPPVHRSATDGYRRLWYRCRTRTELPTAQVVLAGWIPDHVPDTRDTLAPYAQSTPTQHTPGACWVWTIPPWLAHPPDLTDAAALRADLGATTAGAPALLDRPFPGPALPARATITLPWRHRPWVDNPADAADLAYWYHRSAFGQGFDLPGPPVPFWLPAEHAAAFPDAHPLPEGTALRLPFPTVFVCFAEPWELEPRADPDALPALPLLNARGQATARPPRLEQVLQPLQVYTDDRAALPTPLQAIEHYGADVDGLILTADPDGTPSDTFGWCLTIRHPLGLPLGRIVVPASRRATRWHTQIDNTLAGIALAAWHTDPAPPRNKEASTRGGSPDVADADLQRVRVLDIDATSPPSTTGTNRDHPRNPVRPHLRRGHWRRQRVGTGRHSHRWTWVRATTVHGAPRAQQQVYRLS